MDWIAYIVAAVFFLLAGGCVALVVIQLPGTWIILVLAVIVEYVDRFYSSDPDHWTFGWPLLGICLAVAVVGELIEFFAGVLGAKHGGASRRGMIGSLIGGIVGIFLFTPVFFFVPIFGTLLGAILGTFVGAMVGELTDEQARMRQTIKPAIGATIGRVVGTMSKIGVALVLWLSLSVAAFWP